MYLFLYVLAALGVSYWARQDRRNPALWFIAALVLTPLGASAALLVMDRWFSNARRP